MRFFSRIDKLAVCTTGRKLGVEGFAAGRRHTGGGRVISTASIEGW
jgi:hypothetical protein